MGHRLLLAALFCSCTFATRPTLLTFTAETPHAASSWQRIETEAFTLVTDLPTGDAREAAQEIAAELSAVETAFGNAPPRYVHPLEVVVYADGKPFEALYGTGVAAVSRVDAADSRHTLVLWGRPTNFARHNMVGGIIAPGSPLRQALAHAVITRQLASPPRWFLQGMASYLGTYAWSEEGALLELGARDQSLQTAYLKDRSVSFVDVTGPQHAHPGLEQSWARAYAGYCWALLYTAVSQHPEAVGRFMAALARGEDPEPASVFGDGFTPDDIDKAVHLAVRNGATALRQVPLHPKPMSATAFPVDASELGALLLPEGQAPTVTLQR